MSSTKKVIYSIAFAMVILECLFADALIENLVALVIIVILDLNFIYVLWRIEDLED